MTEDSELPAEASPSELLTEVRDLTRQVRAAQRGTWFPLLVFATLFVIAIPVHRFSPHHLGKCRSGPHGTYACTAVAPAVLAYWPIALVLGYVVIAAFYRRQARRRGVGTPIRPYVVVGVVLAALLTAVSLWRLSHPPLPGTAIQIGSLTLVTRGFGTPAVAIGLALLVLAWIERSRALLVFSVGYLVIVLVQAGRSIHTLSYWYFLPQLLVPAVLLLAGSVGFAVFRPSADRSPQ